MMVRFSTKFGQLLMQDEPAQALLRLGGHSGTVPGAVLAGDLPAFLQRLRAGLELHGEAYSPAPPPRAPGGVDDDEEAPGDRPVRLRLRAVPLLEMLETAVRQPSDLMWERA
jgi:hypothetical protein